MSDLAVMCDKEIDIADYASLFQDDDWLVFCKCFYNLYRNRNSCSKPSTLYFGRIPYINLSVHDICADIKRQPYCYRGISVTGRLPPSKAARIFNVLIDPPDMLPLIRKAQLVDIYNNVTFYYAPTDTFLELFDPLYTDNGYDYSCYAFTYEELPRTYQWVYSFYNPDSGLTKIGVSSDIDKRKRSLEYSSGSDLTLLYAVRCHEYLFLERLLHSYYSEYRKNGEWFRLPTQDSAHIEDIFTFIIVQNELFVEEIKEEK